MARNRGGNEPRENTGDRTGEGFEPESATATPKPQRTTQVESTSDPRFGQTPSQHARPGNGTQAGTDQQGQQSPRDQNHGATGDNGESVFPDSSPLIDAGNGAMDNAGHIADGAMNLLVPGYLAHDMVTGGASAQQEQAEALLEAAEQRQKRFDDAKRALEGNGSARNSDELLDDGAMGLEFFDEFVPVYREWTGAGPDFRGEIVRQYDELRGIDFAAFRDDAQRLEGVHRTLIEQNDCMNREFHNARQTWRGSAAESAGAKVDDFLRRGSTVVSETEAVAGAIIPAVDGIQQTVRTYANFVLELGREIQCAGKTPREAKGEIRKARGDVQITDVGFGDVFGEWQGVALTLITGGVAPAAPFFVVDTATKIRNGIIEDAKQWLDTAFVGEFETKYNEFRQQSNTAGSTVQQTYDQMLQAAKVSENPFQESGEPQSTQGGSQSSGASGDSGGSGAPAAAMASGPNPEDPGGMPGGVRPGGMPAPDQQSELGDSGEKAILGEGVDAVSVREPSAKGTVEVAVTSENGGSEAYDVAFEPEAGSGPQASKPGVGTDDGVATGQADSSQPEQESQRGELKEHARAEPGPDGPAVIPEGDRTIPQERATESGIKVSVEIGAGGGEDTSFAAADEISQQAVTATAPDTMPTADGPAPTSPASTTPQSAGLLSSFGSVIGEGLQNSFGSSAGQLFETAENDDQKLSDGRPQPENGSAGLASMRDNPAQQNSQGSTGMASMGESGGGGPNSGGSDSGGAGSGTMMGAMGGMGAQQQTGGEQERTGSSPWRAQGQLFDDGVDPSQVLFGVLGEDKQR